ncbi:type III polyketide synthase [soil metagenome]
MKQNIFTRVLAIGTASPSGSIAQSKSCQQAQQFFACDEKRERALQMLYKRSEIERRSLAIIDQESGCIDKTLFPAPTNASDRGPGTDARMERYSREVAPLALAACRSALTLAEVDYSEITHLVTASCTGFAAPGFDLALIQNLPLSPSTERTHIGFMGCHGALNGLRVADAFCRSNPAAIVLLCAAEICSVHMQYEWSAQRLVANALFADGAAAAVLRASSDEATGAAGNAKYQSSSSIVIGGSTEAMNWKIGDNGFLMTLEAEVPELIEKNLPAFLHGWLAQSGLAIRDIKSWAVHPGGPRILKAVGDCLELESEMLSWSRAVLAQYGNMSSPTVLFILDNLLKQSDKLPCVMLGFGPGLTVEAALINSD